MAQIIQFSTHRECAEKNHGGASKEEPPPPSMSVCKADIIELRPVTLEELLDAVERGQPADVSIGKLLLTFEEAEELLRGDLDKRARERRSKGRVLPKPRAPRSSRASGTR